MSPTEAVPSSPPMSDGAVEPSWRPPLRVRRTYRGSHEEATASFRRDVPRLRKAGFRPVSRVWREDDADLVTVLFLLVIGMVVLLVLWWVLHDRDGELVVSYARIPGFLIDGLSVAERLERNANMRAARLITEEHYQAVRWALLAQL